VHAYLLVGFTMTCGSGAPHRTMQRHADEEHRLFDLSRQRVEGIKSLGESGFLVGVTLHSTRGGLMLQNPTRLHKNDEMPLSYLVSCLFRRREWPIQLTQDRIP
jgi:hypothetical protein